MPRVTVRDVGVGVCVLEFRDSNPYANGWVTRWRTGRRITGIQTGLTFTFFVLQACVHRESARDSIPD